MTVPKHIHMIGIGGIGMSALAQLLAHRGARVSGSDREESPATKLLREKGIDVFIGNEPHMPESAELLVYSDAVPAENAERQRARERGIKQTSYFEMLGIVSRGAYTIAVAGTHGKTTTTGMVAAVLKAAGKEPTAIVGSFVRDFGSNFLPGRRELFVVEACEYRDHLLELSPDVLVITNIELDHTDYFPSLSAMQTTFRAAVERVPEGGCIVTDPSHPAIAPTLSQAAARIVDYTKESVPALKLIGEFNRANARAAKCAARAAFSELDEHSIDEALSSFRGSWRRFEYKGEVQGALVYDDYAHHPTAIRATLEAARQAYPDKKLTVVFHPHLYSRTRDLFDDFATALADADKVILAPIYAAREAPIEGVTSEALAEKISTLGTPAQSFASLAEVRDALVATRQKPQATGLIITMGAGDIYKVAEQLTEE
ncbi:UDP-N-acetylmuramate--L-alanine ligase [Candidatus Kaiserbacteria bacterium CG10_big_fil_rev_8_21_14_0_10_59_10]|uniref:UDP-N-acetylmuramate--L-alanine ligase n=1 Tax=Candidatus Kaiserbacteria bacterium CG10_big_fil_rev_8_21_14_0_10_59_10 TaxID=1974612 RepID=A0A2H0U9H9_9BACT|nr:MAG: UDP-N-acetylmuramate--L-alanine ligase [Candidatus Kaiserbacteria bacterium CG10_big_fil_rev_8_21_14_0_10_59_10]